MIVSSDDLRRLLRLSDADLRAEVYRWAWQERCAERQWAIETADAHRDEIAQAARDGDGVDVYGWDAVVAEDATEGMVRALESEVASRLRDYRERLDGERQLLAEYWGAR